MLLLRENLVITVFTGKDAATEFIAAIELTLPTTCFLINAPSINAAALIKTVEAGIQNIYGTLENAKFEFCI